MSEKRVLSIPLCHDKKFDKVDTDFLTDNIKGALEAYSSLGDEYVTFLTRSQDANGEWYFGVMVTSLKALEPGNEVYLAPNRKLVVVEV